jgi:hypothetical protein
MSLVKFIIFAALAGVFLYLSIIAIQRLMEAKEDVDTANKELEIANQEQQQAANEFQQLIIENGQDEEAYYIRNGCVREGNIYSCPPGVQSYASTVN